MSDDLTKLNDAAIAYHNAGVKLAAAKARMEELLKPLSDAVDGWGAEVKRLLRDAGMESISINLPDGKVLQCSLEPKHVPKVTDWDALYDWIHQTRQFSLLHRRLSATPVVEAYQMALDELEVKCHGELTPEERDAFIAERLPPGVIVDEFKELRAKVVPAKRARRARI